MSESMIQMQRKLADVTSKLEKAERELAEAQATLAKLREQEPVAWVREDGNLYLAWQKDLCLPEVRFSPLYAAPVPAVSAEPAYLLERQVNGLSWYISASTRWGGSWHWTADVNSAIRFSREEDAAAYWVIISQYHVGIGGSGIIETTPKQHIFDDARAMLQSAEGYSSQVRNGDGG